MLHRDPGAPLHLDSPPVEGKMHGSTMFVIGILIIVGSLALLALHHQLNFYSPITLAFVYGGSLGGTILMAFGLLHSMSEL